MGLVAATVVGGACSSDASSPSAPTTGGSSTRETGRVPEPVGMVRSSWSIDPFALGSYSFLPVGADPKMRRALAAPVDGVVWFAGEATSASSPSTVHGALDEGARVAAAVDRSSLGPLDVVVIGAGAAGARAARKLHEAGHRVTVVEGRDVTGGRLHTLRPKGWPVPVELGASWVHDTEASDLAAELRQLDVATVPFSYDDLILTADGGQASADEFDAAAAEALDAAVEWADGRDADRSLAQALDASGEAEAVDADALEHFLRTEISTEYGADADELSAWWGLAEGSEGDDVLVTGGYRTVVDHDLDGLEVRTGWVVSSVAIDAGGAVVRSDDGEELQADRVVVTVPLGVLQEGVIAFDPPLPDDKQRAIRALGMGLLDKVWLRWDEPWWTEDAEQWTLVAGAEEPYVEWFNLLPATGEPVLLGLVGGSVARRWAERSDDAVVAASLRTLQAFADAGW